jgi:hypothetical protein
MKRNQQLWLGLLAASLLGTLNATAQLAPSRDRLSFSARFGLNFSATMTGASAVPVPPTTRTTPDGDTYNYDNGYIFPDVSGSGDGYTWYWGYDGAGQIDSGNNTILLGSATGSASLNSPDLDEDPAAGMELTYTRELGVSENFRYGFEGALNYLNISFSGGGYDITAPITSDAYAFTPGTTPPGAPYEGTFDGPGYVIGTTPVSSTTALGTVGTATGSRDFEAGLWGARVGPYAEFYLKKTVSVSLSGGLALGWLHGSASWDETLAFSSGAIVSDSGSGSDDAFLVGGYLAANLYWRLAEHWSAAGSVQFQSLGDYDESFGTRRVEVDLSQSFLFSVGVCYNF